MTFHQHLVLGTTNDGLLYPCSRSFLDLTSLCTMPSKGKHKAGVLHTKVERGQTSATVRIVNQIPTQRFRYNNEGRTGRRNQNRNFLELQPNFGESHTDYKCTVFCVCDGDTHVPHPNALVGKDCKEGVYSAKLKPEKGVLKLPHLQIERKKKGDVQETWDERAKQLLSPYTEQCQGLADRKFATSKVRLYIHVTALDTGTTATCLSGVITSEREGIQVDIHALSHYSAAVTGGETIYIMTTEQGPDIKPGDFEVFLSTDNWSSTPLALKADDILYKKVIKYTVPPYQDQNITDTVTVMLNLNWIRSKQRVAYHFQYRPEPDHVVSDRRQQIKRPLNRDLAVRDGPSGKVMRFDPRPTQHLPRKLSPELLEDDNEDYLAQSPQLPASESDYAVQMIAEDNSGQDDSQVQIYPGQPLVYQLPVSYTGHVYTEDVGEAGEKKTYAVLQSSSQPHNMPLSPVSDAGVEREEEMEVETSQHAQCTEPQPQMSQQVYTGKSPIQLSFGKRVVTLYPIQEPAQTAVGFGKQGVQYVQAQQCSEDTMSTPSSLAQGTGISRGKLMYEGACTVAGPSPPSASPLPATSASVGSAGGKGTSEGRTAHGSVASKGKTAGQSKTRPATLSSSGGRLHSQGKGKPGNIPNFLPGFLDTDDRIQQAAPRLGDREDISHSQVAPTSASPPSSTASASTASSSTASSTGIASTGSTHTSRMEARADFQPALVKSEMMEVPQLPSNLPSFGTHLALTTSLPSIPFNFDLKLPSQPILPGGTLSTSSLPSLNLTTLGNLTSMDIEKECAGIIKMTQEPGTVKS